MVILVFGLTSRQRLSTVRHSWLSDEAMALGSLYLPAFMLSMVSLDELPRKGSYPTSMPQRMTPVDQTSNLPSNFWFLALMKHSGAMQARLPVSRSSHLRVLMAPAMPKSMILILLSQELTSSKFSSLRSRWVRLFWWQYSMPFTICLTKPRAASQSSLPAACTCFSSSPPSRYSMMMTTSIFLSVRHLWTLTMLGWLSERSTSASTKMESMSAAEPMFSVLMTLIANCSPLCLWRPRKTFPNPPSPSILVVSYSAKQLPGSNSSPLEAQRTDLCLMKSKSSSKHSAPSELNSLRVENLNSFPISLKEFRLRKSLTSTGFCSGLPFSQIKTCVGEEILCGEWLRAGARLLRYRTASVHCFYNKWKNNKEGEKEGICVQDIFWLGRIFPLMLGLLEGWMFLLVYCWQCLMTVINLLMRQSDSAKPNSMNSTHHMSCNHSYATHFSPEGRPGSSALPNYAHLPMPKEDPRWNQSSATWRHTSHKYSFSRQDRFRDNPLTYSDILEPNMPSSLNPAKSCTFGKGHRRPISEVVLRNAKEKPAPDRYNLEGHDEQTRRKSLGKTFGLGWKAYERNFIKHRSDAYAEFHSEHNPPAKYEVREVPGGDKLKFTAYGRLKMFSEKMAEGKNWVPGPHHKVNDRHLYGMVGLNERNFSFGERIDFAKPANDNPEAIYHIPGFCERFGNLKRKKERSPMGK